MALLFFVRISGRYSSGVGMVGNRIDETLRRRFRIQGNFIEYVARSLDVDTPDDIVAAGGAMKNKLAGWQRDGSPYLMTVAFDLEAPRLERRASFRRVKGALSL
ncbi:hypothetical protein [Rhizobium leguminosarum]